MMTSNVVVAHKPENFRSHYSTVYCNCHHLCAFKLCTVYLSHFSRGQTREDLSWQKPAKKISSFGGFFSTLMLLQKIWTVVLDIVSKRQWLHRRQQRCHGMAFACSTQQRHRLSVYVVTLGASILDSSSSCRQPLRNSSSVRLPSLFSSILELKKKEITAWKKESVANSRQAFRGQAGGKVGKSSAYWWTGDFWWLEFIWYCDSWKNS